MLFDDDYTVNEKKLREAVKNNDVSMARDAVRGDSRNRGANINCSYGTGAKAVFDTIRHRHKEMLQFLIEKGVDLEDKNGTFEGTPLIDAASERWLLGVKMLLEAGANVQAKNKYGETAAYYAAQEHSLPILQLLEKHGADIYQTDQVGTTLLLAAAEGIHGGNSAEALEMVQYLVKKGLDVNQVPKTGYSPLMAACSRNYLSVAKYLVEHGANMNAQNVKGQTAIMIAAEKGNIDVVKYLTQQGARFDIQDEKGNLLSDYFKNNEEMFEDLEQMNTTAFKRVAQENIDSQTGDELFEMTLRDAGFLQQLVTTGMVVNAVQKMTYEQTMSLYKTAEKTMPPEVKKHLQDAIRDKR